MEKRNDYGVLINPPLNLQRKNFKECCNLLGVRVKYRYPMNLKQYTTQGELESDYSEPIDVWCLFDEHPDQKTTKLLGWNAERDTEMQIISVPYDLVNLQSGSLFEIPSALDNAKSRVFRVTDMSTIMIYPASVTCKLVPYYETTVPKADTKLFVNTNFNVLYDGDEVED